MKAVGRLNGFYAILFGADAFYHIRISVLHVTGQVSAPWSLRPGWIAFQANLLLTAILALIAGPGLYRLKRWGFGAELLFLYSFALIWPVAITAYSKPLDLPDFALGVSLMSALAAPLLNLPDVRGSVVFTPDYHRVIDATPQIRVRPRLPWELKIASIFIFIVHIFIGILAAANGRL